MRDQLLLFYTTELTTTAWNYTLKSNWQRLPEYAKGSVNETTKEQNIGTRKPVVYKSGKFALLAIKFFRCLQDYC